MALGNQDAADVVREQLFSDPLYEAIQEWEAMPADERPLTPLETDAYVVPAYEDAEALASESEARFEAGFDADEQGDRFELSVVFFAVTLFGAGVAALMRSSRVQAALLIGSAVVLTLGFVMLGIVQTA